MYNEDDLIPALWHEEPVCLRDYPADSSSWDEVQYDDATGLPITKDGYAVYRNTNYVPMGFAYDYYLTQTEYEETAKHPRKPPDACTGAYRRGCCSLRQVPHPSAGRQTGGVVL